jgi:hypothetical protein
MATRKTRVRRKMAQISKMLSIFEETNGRQPRSMTELRHWMASAEGQVALTPHIDPADGTLVVDRRKFNRLPAKARS